MGRVDSSSAWKAVQGQAEEGTWLAVPDLVDSWREDPACWDATAAAETWRHYRTETATEFVVEEEEEEEADDDASACQKAAQGAAGRTWVAEARACCKGACDVQMEQDVAEAVVVVAVVAVVAVAVPH